mgnify:CR=1 FL=1
MAELTVPKVDFAPLGELADVYKKGQNERGLNDAFSQGIGSDPQSLAALAQRVGPYNPQLAVNLAQLAHTYTRQGTQDARQAALDTFNQNMEKERLRLSQNADQRAAKASEEEKTTVKEVTNPDGTSSLVRVKVTGAEGPIAGTTSAPAPRNMSVNDITKLNEEGNKFSSIAGFSDTFKPEYAGHTILGDKVNTAGRILPESVVGKTVAEGASWWQGYDRFKNVVRNELFGSALTAPEKEAFEKADVNPRMDPAQIQKNLALQKAIATKALQNKASAMLSAGYKADTVAKAYGIDPRMIGGDAAPAPTTGSTGPTIQYSANGPAAEGQFPPPPKVGEMRGGYRFRGGNPGDPTSWAKAAN